MQEAKYEAIKGLLKDREETIRSLTEENAVLKFVCSAVSKHR